MLATRTIWNRLYQYISPYRNPDIKDRVSQYCIETANGLGTYAFGTDPQAFEIALHLAWFLYRKYFRVQVHGWEHLCKGPLLVASNHSGHLPFDAMMINTGFFLEAPHPVVLHGMVDRHVARLPFISTLFTRLGHMVGTRRVCRQLLQSGASVLVFPEGVAGISKPFSQRYQLQNFGHGFVKLAMQTGVPVLPIALVGAEEQAISVANIKPLAKLLHLPYFPLILPQLCVPIPLPVRYTLYIGKPLDFGSKNLSPSEKTVVRGVARVKNSIRAFIARGLRNRQTVF